MTTSDLLLKEDSDIVPSDYGLGVLALPSIATDAYYNPLWKLGNTAQNGSIYNDYNVTMLSNNQQRCLQLFRGSWLARKIIQLLAKEMVKGGIDIKGIPVDEADELQTMWMEFGIEQKLKELIINGRLFGGAIAAIVVAGQNPAAELNVDRVTRDSFLGLKVFDRWRLSSTLQFDPLSGYPTSYDIVVNMINADPNLEVTQQINNAEDAGFLKFDASRVLRYDGDYLPNQDFINNNHWHASVLEAIMESINNYSTSSAALTSMARNASTRVYKMQGLSQKLAQLSTEKALNNLETLLQRITVSAGVEGITVVDSESDISVLNTNIDGQVRANENLALDVCAAAEAPYTLIYGNSASGMNATGEGDLKNWQGTVKSERNKIHPGVMKMLKVMYRSRFGKAPPETLRFDFAPLDEISALDKATVTEKRTNAVVNAYNAGFLSEKVALSELKRGAETTGDFDSITDEDIEAADVDPPEPETIDETDPNAAPLDKEQITETEVAGGEEE